MMLTQRLERVVPFRRGDALRFAVASVALIGALTAVLAIDVIPSGLGLEVGDVARTNIRSPRAIVYESAILTEQARAAARDSVAPQYDYTPERATGVAAQQMAAFDRSIGPIDAAFTSGLPAPSRQDLLRVVLPALSESGRATLVDLTPERWQTLRAEGERVVGQLERTELRDSELAGIQSSLASVFAASMASDERRLMAEIVAPLLVPNSSYSPALTLEARDQAARNVPGQQQQISQDEIIVREGTRITALDLEKVDAVHLNESRLDV
ncbi:MAG TPA: hypothetical protein VIV06_03560, partial [Candidatus Limnocylindrales bacterium]